ncbi:hypothetical protein G9A89_001910 [Geosiphon pyriformis]|nr:hypothetical protein G9A89_001910 [Geosiphon pyriformis]
MGTESSPSLVSGATSDGAWETITSHQRFAGATFKIKLAYVKAVFQSVHGFLGAKSVSKDNVKLFCLTSSVYLATFKIAKSLVVSESGSLSTAVVLHDVPLGVSAADIKTAFSVFDMVTCVVLKPAGIWQYVVVHFKKLDSVMSALNYWSVLTILSRNRFKAKLVNLLSGCTVFEISNMISQVGGQSCFIFWSPDSDHYLRFALVMFGSQADLNLAIANTNMLRKCHHLAVDCKVALSSFPKTLKVFKPSAPSVVSEFFPLVASVSLVAVVDSAVGSRLDSLEKQISDLAALDKSIVEPVGSLVVLVSCLLDDNAVKTV